MHTIPFQLTVDGKAAKCEQLGLETAALLAEIRVVSRALARSSRDA